MTYQETTQVTPQRRPLVREVKCCGPVNNRTPVVDGKPNYVLNEPIAVFETTGLYPVQRMGGPTLENTVYCPLLDDRHCTAGDFKLCTRHIVIPSGDPVDMLP